ncbi:MAG: hypothetical protein LC796_14685 [Acidobacteria bacterium]|nr:hypothetical protein [Acidobacteriota bacterium]
MTPVFLAAAAAFFAQIPASPLAVSASSPAVAADIERCDAMLLPRLERYERSRSAANARSALRAARAARESLERLSVPSPLEDARREELTFFNHVIIGISGWLEAPGRPGARQALDAILRRGRAHRERAVSGRR